MLTKLTKEEQKQEALKRMKALQLHKDVVDAFEKEGRLYYSIYGERTLYQVKSEEWLSHIREFEKKTQRNCLSRHLRLR